jgi:hypothetical protein
MSGSEEQYTPSPSPSQSTVAVTPSSSTEPENSNLILPKIECPKYRCPSLGYLTSYTNQTLTEAELVNICSESCISNCDKCYTKWECFQCSKHYNPNEQNTKCLEDPTREALEKASSLLVFVVIALIVFGIFCWMLRVRKLEGFEKNQLP